MVIPILQMRTRRPRQMQCGFPNSGTVAFPPPHRSGGLIGLGTPLTPSPCLSSVCSITSCLAPERPGLWPCP